MEGADDDHDWVGILELVLGEKGPKGTKLRAQVGVVPWLCGVRINQNGFQVQFIYKENIYICI